MIEKINKELERLEEDSEKQLVLFHDIVELLSKLTHNERLRLDVEGEEAELWLRTNYDYETGEWLDTIPILRVTYKGGSTTMEGPDDTEWWCCLGEADTHVPLAVAHALHYNGVKQV